MAKPILAVDVDGVLADWNSAFVDLLNTREGLSLKIPEGGFQSWDWVTKDLAVPSEIEDAAWTWIKLHPSWWLELDPLPGARMALDELFHLARLDHLVVYFLTSRVPASAQLYTNSWLARHGFKGANVIVAAKAALKAQICQGIGATHLIEDKLSSAIACQHKGTKAYLIDLPYSRNQSPEIERVQDVLDALSRVQKATGLAPGVGVSLP